MTLEHVRYSRGHNPCLFIFGRDNAGDQVKIRWYPQREDTFGELLRKSPFFRVKAPWIFAVQKEGDVMEMVGSLPNLGRIRIEADEAELENMKKLVGQLMKESERFEALSKKQTNNEANAAEYDFLNDSDLSVDEKSS